MDSLGGWQGLKAEERGGSLPKADVTSGASQMPKAVGFSNSFFLGAGERAGNLLGWQMNGNKSRDKDGCQ